MPRRDSGYGPAYQRAKRNLKGKPCHVCGKAGSDSVDHVPAIQDHTHRDGAGCCRLLPAHLSCNIRVSGGWRAAVRPSALNTGNPPTELEVVEAVGISADDPCWRKPWLEDLLEVPSNAVWPRYMSAPHPSAVGSLGGEFCEWAEERTGLPFRWWQRLVSFRLLEVDAEGRLVNESLLMTLARQLGKSWWLREMCLWRIHQGGRFGEPQEVVHTGKDVAVCKEMQRQARLWARARPGLYRVREVNGQEEIEFTADGSRWMVRAKEAVYGYSASMAVADEAWKVASSTIEEGLVPTMVERAQSQLLLVTTSHRRMTRLVLDRRASCLSQLWVPGSDLFCEWSAPRDAALDDPVTWRMASPHWTPRRERLVGRAYERALAGDSDDPDEPDPVESFRSQWLNQAPLRAFTGKGEPLVEPAAWRALAGRQLNTVGGWCAVDDNRGNGAAIAYAASDGERFEVDGESCGSWGEALERARRFVMGGPGRGVVLADTLREQPPKDFPGRRRICRMGSVEARRGMSLLRTLVADGRVVHDVTPELDAQLEAVRVKPIDGGLSLLPGPRADLVRAALWALWAAQNPVRSPSVH